MKKILLIITILATSLIFVSCGEKQSSDIINPDARFLYFYGLTCPHCQELNKKVEESDLFSKIAVEKREVYYNNTNREIFLGVAKKVGAKDPGVPFVVDRTTGEYAVGVTPALELFQKGLITSTGSSTSSSGTQVGENSLSGQILEKETSETQTGNTLSGAQNSVK